MELSHLKCNQCHWEGSFDEVDREIVGTCMRTDKTEVCPRCGSLEVFSVIKKI